MSRRETIVLLHHMLDHAREASGMARGTTRGDLDRDRKLNLALVRLLEITGEAASRVSPNERVRYPAIPWPEIVSLRNRLIHGYDAVDFDILWEVITKDLPKLISELENAVSA
ncbi:MAG: DUF86 domain-containing protein [Chloroflexi bacterium]|nr:DUF86 domain-containing protein [Chloroflexota bacterium]